MPIERHWARGETEVVTFTKYQIEFSTALVHNKSLGDFQYVVVGVDPELCRIYFGFHKEPVLGGLRFFQQSDRSPRKMIAAGGLYANYKWIRPLKTEKEKRKRQFRLHEVDSKDTDVYAQYQYFVELGHVPEGTSKGR